MRDYNQICCGLMEIMMKTSKYSIILNLTITLFTVFLFSCTKEIHHVKGEEHTDGLYDSEFPAKPTSESLEDILSSVKLLSTIAFYESYEFDAASQLIDANINEDSIEEHAISKYHFNQPATGTATVVYTENRTVALLTCAHIVHFPDTIIAYYRDPDGRETNIIKTVAFKIRQNINIIDFMLGSDFKILAMDKKNDIALIGKSLQMDISLTVPVFKYPKGRSTELNWGTFIYVVGFPRGEKMITRGLVSQPPRRGDDTFVIDAVFNRGFSGGIVVAIRDGVPNYELVGMAKSVPAETKLYLAPEKSFRILESSPQDIYTGEAKVGTYESIFYGITYVVTTEQISEFIDKNSEILKNAGYSPHQFFPVK